MPRHYYSRRTKPGTLTLDTLYWKLRNLYLRFRDADYFREKAGITETDLPKSITYEAAIALDFQPFPVTKWAEHEVTEEHVFDMLEFLFDRVSKPCGWTVKEHNDFGEPIYDYEGYDVDAGQEEYRSQANLFLGDYKTGFELTKDGNILALGGSLQQILNAEIIPYDEVHVDSKVRAAIQKWRNRELSLAARKEAIRELADVFEWLRKTKNLSAVLDNKDESALFDIANNFAIRHHNPKQKANYDPVIWYSWIFHFYLATYHASIHLLKKKEAAKKPKSTGT